MIGARPNGVTTAVVANDFSTDARRKTFGPVLILDVRSLIHRILEKYGEAEGGRMTQ